MEPLVDRQGDQPQDVDVDLLMHPHRVIEVGATASAWLLGTGRGVKDATLWESPPNEQTLLAKMIIDANNILLHISQNNKNNKNFSNFSNLRGQRDLK